MSTITTLKLSDLPAKQAAALRDKARRLGVTPEQYVKQLITEDLALDNQARERSFAELSLPFERGLAGMSDGELDFLARLTKRQSPRRP
jgi:hypothetical protein